MSCFQDFEADRDLLGFCKSFSSYTYRGWRGVGSYTMHMLSSNTFWKDPLVLENPLL